MARGKISAPTMPKALDVRAIHVELFGRKAQNRLSDERLREIFAAKISEDPVLRNNYAVLMFWIGRSLQRAIADLQERKRVCLADVNRYVMSSDFRLNEERYNADYIEENEREGILLMLQAVKKSVTIHIQGLVAFNLSSLHT